MYCLIANSPFNAVISIYIPCSEKAYGRYLEPPDWPLNKEGSREVTNCDLTKYSTSSLVN